MIQWDKTWNAPGRRRGAPQQ